MKVTLELPVRYMDVDSEGKLRINTLLAYLQEAAIWHASQCGDSPEEIRARGAGWALIKLGASITGEALYGDSLHVETWSRGSSGLKAYRDFVVRNGEREIARGSSVWVYMNMDTGRMARIASEHMAKYCSESGLATDIDLDAWKPAAVEEADATYVHSIRSQDIDTNQHLNNTQYAALVDSAVSRYLGKRASYSQILLNYERAVEAGQQEVEVKIKQTDESIFDFSVNANGSVCCRGQAILTPNQP